jgi:hypothetical protein
LAAETRIEHNPTRIVVRLDQTERVQVPVAIATGHYEKLTDEELLEHYRDISAEINRRTGDATKPGAAG